MAGPWNLQTAAVDFSPLGQLYSGFIGAQDHARKQKQEDEAGPLFEKMLAAYGQQQGAGAQPGSLSALAAQTGGMPGLPGNGAAAAVTPKGPPGEREKQAFDFFVSQGHSPAAAAGIVGNLVQESGLNPGAINRGDGADGSHSIGIGQWNAGRAKALQQFAAERGTSVGDLNTQLAFVQHELSGPESRVGQQLRGVNDPQAAAGIFAGYERPRGWREGGDPSQIHGWQNRSGTAARLMAAYGGNVPANVAPRGDVQVASLGPVGVPPQAAMPTQNPNGGETPQADLPSPNAAEAQFYVPGAGGPAAAPRPPAPAPAPPMAAPAGLPGVAAATGGGMQPELRAALAAGLRNPQTRAAAMELWKQVASPTSQFDFQVVGDQLYRTNKRTGQIEPVQGVTKPAAPVSVSEGSRLVDPATGRVVFDGGPKNDATPDMKNYQQAKREGFTGTLLDYQKATDRSPKISVGESAAERERLANQYGLEGEDRRQFIFNGKIPSQGEKAPTEGQANADTYADRMMKAEKVLEDPAAVEAAGSSTQRTLGAVPLVGNRLVSEKFQLAEQAQRDFINAVLRRESGAAISPSEFENARKQYFPQPGDSPAVLKQKADNRRTSIDGVARAGSPKRQNERKAQDQDGWREIAPGVRVREVK